MCVPKGQSKLVVWSADADPNEVYSGIGVTIDKIEIRWGCGNSSEYTDASIVRIRHLVNLLLEYGPGTDVTGTDHGVTG